MKNWNLAVCILLGAVVTLAPLMYERQRSLHLLKTALQQDTESSVSLPPGRLTGTILFFDTFGSSSERMRSWYVQGRAEYEAEQYSRALFSFHQALGEFRRNGDLHYGGLIHRNLADIYSRSLDFARDSLHLKEAYRLFSENGEPDYALETLLRLGNAHSNARRWDRAEACFEAVLEAVPRDSLLYAYALVDGARALLSREDKQPRRAVSMLEEAGRWGYRLTEDEMVELAYGYHLLGDGRGRSLLDSLASVGYGSPLMEYRAYLMQPEGAAAVSHIAAAMQAMDAGTREALSRSVNQVRGDYLELALEEEKHRTGRYRLRMVLRTLLALAFAAGIWITMRRRLRRKEQEAEHIRSTLEQMRSVVVSLEAKQRKTAAEKTALRREIRERDGRISEIQSRFLSLYRKQFRDIGQIIIDMDGTKDFVEKEKALYGRICRLFRRINGDRAAMAGLKKDIDDTFDGLASQLEEDVPGLSEEERKLFYYSVIGFDGKLISLLMGMEQADNVYSRRYRFKQKLQRLQPLKRDRYLPFLEK